MLQSTVVINYIENFNNFTITFIHLYHDGKTAAG